MTLSPFKMAKEAEGGSLFSIWLLTNCSNSSMFAVRKLVRVKSNISDILFMMYGIITLTNNQGKYRAKRTNVKNNI